MRSCGSRAAALLLVLTSCGRAPPVEVDRPNEISPVAPGPRSIEPVPIVAAPRPDWRAADGLVPATSLDVPTGPGGEVMLLPFAYDGRPVPAWRYDACVAANLCPARALAQPEGDPDDAPAVGMRWEDANTLCVARGMSAQSPLQDRAIRDSGATPISPDRITAGSDATHVRAGFRCVRTLE